MPFNLAAVAGTNDGSQSSHQHNHAEGASGASKTPQALRRQGGPIKAANEPLIWARWTRLGYENENELARDHADSPGRERHAMDPAFQQGARRGRLVGRSRVAGGARDAEAGRAGVCDVS